MIKNKNSLLSVLFFLLITSLLMVPNFAHADGHDELVDTDIYDMIPFDVGENEENAFDTSSQDTVKQSIDNVTGDASGLIGLSGEGVTTLRDKAKSMTYIISALIFGFAVIMITFAGFKYATSEGDSSKMRSAKMQIIAAGIGIGISLFNLVIIQMFNQILKL